MSNADVITGKGVAIATSGVVAVGGSSVPARTYGDYLISNGFLVLSYAEWIQVIGCAYVITLLVKTVIIPVGKKIIKVYKSWAS